MFRTMSLTIALGLALTAAAQAADPTPFRPARPYTPGIGQKVTLNPQPLPPKWRPPESPFSKVLLNPQPLPPKTVGSPYEKVKPKPEPQPRRVIYTPWGKRVIRR